MCCGGGGVNVEGQHGAWFDRSQQRSQTSKQSSASSQGSSLGPDSEQKPTILIKSNPRAGARLTVRGAEGTTIDLLSRSCARISSEDLQRLLLRPRGMVLVMLLCGSDVPVGEGVCMCGGGGGWCESKGKATTNKQVHIAAHFPPQLGFGLGRAYDSIDLEPSCPCSDRGHKGAWYVSRAPGAAPNQPSSGHRARPSGPCTQPALLLLGRRLLRYDSIDPQKRAGVDPKWQMGRQGGTNQRPPSCDDARPPVLSAFCRPPARSKCRRPRADRSRARLPRSLARHGPCGPWAARSGGGGTGRLPPACLCLPCGGGHRRSKLATASSPRPSSGHRRPQTEFDPKPTNAIAAPGRARPGWVGRAVGPSNGPEGAARCAWGRPQPALKAAAPVQRTPLGCRLGRQRRPSK